ncbi:hypothetical protein [Sphaerisporangium dianthi]|uniref:Transmembrane protein n=1 Tax=Sphaerisporangium dianthi TaxID=1436120 RepID=A0ABV9CUB9_9ACTN
MSSAFLYLGIVLMWLCVLVPMWLRRDRHTFDIIEPYTDVEEQEDSDDSGEPGECDEGSEGDTLAEAPVAKASAGQAPAADPADDEITMEIDASASAPAASPAATAPAAPRRWTTSGTSAGSGAPSTASPEVTPTETSRSLAGSSAEEFAGPDLEDLPGDGVPGEHVSAPDASMSECRRRARVMARRRRWLLFSVLLHIASVVTAAVGVAPWWSIAPSVVVVVAYLAVLRVAVAVDAERRAAEAKAHAERRRRAREREQALELAAQQAEAEVIEFRKRAEPFDQYADRSRRAVGD